MGLTQSDPGNISEIRQIHVSGKAVEGKLYYAYGEDGKIKTYRGTHQGRLKEENNLITAEQNIISNDTDINNNKIEINKNAENIEVLDKTKADKCFAIAMSIVLG